MNWINRSFNISNVIRSRSQSFGRINTLKKLCKILRKTPALVCILIKMQASNLQPEIFIKKETPSRIFSCEFCKKFKNTFFKEHFCNFNSAKVRLSIYLLLVLFLYFQLTISKVLIYTVKIAHY